MNQQVIDNIYNGTTNEVPSDCVKELTHYESLNNEQKKAMLSTLAFNWNKSERKAQEALKNQRIDFYEKDKKDYRMFAIHQPLAVRVEDNAFYDDSVYYIKNGLWNFFDGSTAYPGALMEQSNIQNLASKDRYIYVLEKDTYSEPFIGFTLLNFFDVIGNSQLWSERAVNQFRFHMANEKCKGININIDIDDYTFELSTHNYNATNAWKIILARKDTNEAQITLNTLPNGDVLEVVFTNGAANYSEWMESINENVKHEYETLVSDYL